MPGLRHDGLVELVRQHPPLAVDLVRLMDAYPLPDDVVAVLGSEDMTDVTPITGKPQPKPQTYAADSVVIASDRTTGRRLLAIVVELQGEASDDKDISWPVYATTARKANKCPKSALIVLCWDTAEARKCRRTIQVGPRGFDLAPDVVDRGHAPDLTKAGPYTVLCFAALNAVDLETHEGQVQVVDALIASGARTHDHKELSDLILGLAPTDVAREQLRSLMMSIPYKDPLTEHWAAVGREEGREKGREEGIEQGLARAKGEDLLKIMDARSLKPSEKQRAQVTSSTDLGQLDLWFDRALTADSADEVFRP
jgi:hypothetical protein